MSISTSDENVKEKQADIRNQIDRCLVAIKAGDRYERLLANKDFQDMLKDLEDTIKMHRYEMENLDIDLLNVGTDDKKSPEQQFQIVLWARRAHLEQVGLIQQAIRRPAQLVEIGRAARETMDVLKKQQKELANA